MAEKEKATFLSAVTKATTVNKINSMIIFGEYGTGKTFLGASADDIEDYSPVLIVDIEGSSAGVGRKYPGVDVVQADSYAKLEFIREELRTKEHGYKTVIFDTLNVAQYRAEAHFRTLPENQGNKFGVWGDLKKWTIDFVREGHGNKEFLAIYIAHPNVDKDENTGKMTTTVKIAGSAKTDVPTIPDLIGYLEFQEDEDGDLVRVLQVGRNNKIITKNRFGLPNTIWPTDKEGPTLFDIQQAIVAAQFTPEDEEKKAA